MIQAIDTLASMLALAWVSACRLHLNISGIQASQYMACLRLPHDLDQCCVKMTMQEDTSYSQIGGARVGSSTWLSFNFSVPFARITVTPEGIALKVSFLGLGKTYEIKREELCSIERYRGVFSKGIKIEHQAEGYPKFMVFWSRKHDELIANLATHGYKISAVEE